MIDDRTFRIIFTSAIVSLIGVFWPQLSRLMHRLGFRKGPSETGWKRGLKVIGIAVLLAVVALALS